MSGHYIYFKTAKFFGTHDYTHIRVSFGDDLVYCINIHDKSLNCIWKFDGYEYDIISDTNISKNTVDEIELILSEQFTVGNVKHIMTQTIDGVIHEPQCFW